VVPTGEARPLTDEEIKERSRSEVCCIVTTTTVIIASVLLLGVAGGLGVAWAVGLFDDDDNNDDIGTRSNVTLEPSTSPPTTAPVPTSAPTGPTPTQAPTTAMFASIQSSACDFLPLRCGDLSNPDTPQYQALEWLAENPGVETMSEATQLARLGMATLYFSTDGANWRNSSNWISTTLPICDWYSSSAETICDANGNLLRLELDNNLLSGPLPHEVSHIRSLTTISIQSSGGRALNGTLPDSLSLIPGLTSIVITGNTLSGGAPAAYGQLTNIETLDLKDNGLSGELSTSFGPFSKAVTIDLSDNSFSGAVPGAIAGSTTDLTTLDLSGNGFISLPSALSSLQGIRNLYVQGNSFASFPAVVEEMTTLVRLDLSNNQIGGVIPPGIGNLVNLKDLSLAGNAFSGEIISAIGNLVNLRRRLDLSNNALTGDVPSFLGSLTQLQRLILNNNEGLTGAVPASFANLDQLQSLHIEFTGLTGNIPTAVCTLFDSINPIAWADCSDHADDAPCFQYCCGADSCQCRYGSTDSRCFG